MSYTETTTEEAEETGSEGLDARYWCEQLSIADKEAATFLKQGEDAYKEYTYSKCAEAEFSYSKAMNQHIALYWSNIQTLMPAIYSQTPSPVIKRRFDDNDPVGRVAAEGLERMARSLLDRSRFDKTMDRITQDLLIPGRGLGRVYYEGDPDNPADTERITPAWVPYQSIRTTPGARDYSEIWWVSFDLYLDRRKFDARFGETLPDWREKIAFNYSSTRKKQDSETDEPNTGKYTCVTEIWNKRDRKIYWVSRDYKEGYLDQKDDIYELVQFFPNSEPVQLTVGDETYYPVSDFVQYRQALLNVDMFANRIFRLLRALRARGVYDASQDAIRRLAQESDEGDLIPVENYIDFAEKGGLEGMIQYAPTDVLAGSLIQCYDALERQKQIIYEVTGISDIIRGSSNASETATAQQIKSQFADLRLRRRVKEMARCARELIELMCDLALKRFSDQSITDIAGVSFMPPEDQQMWPQALQLLRDDKFRTFRIEIETDSTIALSGEAEREARVSLLTALSDYFNQIVTVGANAPELLPAMSDAALHALRGLRQSSAIEGSIEASVEAFKERLLQPQEAPPDPKIQIEQMKQEFEGQKLQIETQLEQQKAQSEMQMEQMRLQFEAQLEQAKLALEQAKLEVEREKLAVDSAKVQADVQATAEELQVKREETAAEIEIEKLKATVELLTARMAAMQVEREAAEAAEAGEGGEGGGSGGGKGAKGMPTIHIHNGGSKIGGWVDTPEGRKLVVKDLPSEMSENGG